MTPDRYEAALQTIALHPDCTREVYKIAADALVWTRRFDDVDRTHAEINHLVSEALATWWQDNGTGGDPPYSLGSVISSAVRLGLAKYQNPNEPKR